MPETDLTTRIKVVTTGVKGELDKTEKEIKDIGKAGETSSNKISTMAPSFALVAAAAAATILVFNKVKANLQETISAFKGQEQAEARLAQALKNQNEFTEENIKMLKELATARQKVTVFGDEATISAQAMLASFKLNTKQIMEITPLMQDLATMTARATGTQSDLESIAKLVGLALEGQAGRLRQAGISLTEFQVTALANATSRAEKMSIVMQVLADNAEGLAVATGATATGGIDIMNNAISDLKEVIGESLVEGLKPFIKELTEWVQKDETKEMISNLANAFMYLTTNVLPMVVIAFKPVIFVINSIATLINAAKFELEKFAGSAKTIISEFSEEGKEVEAMTISLGRASSKRVNDIRKAMTELDHLSDKSTKAQADRMELARLSESAYYKAVRDGSKESMDIADKLFKQMKQADKVATEAKDNEMKKLRELNLLQKNVREEVIDAVRKQVDAEENLITKTEESMQAWLDAEKKLNDEIAKDIEKTSKEATKAWESYVNNTMNNLQKLRDDFFGERSEEVSALESMISRRQELQDEIKQERDLLMGTFLGEKLTNEEMKKRIALHGDEISALDKRFVAEQTQIEQAEERIRQLKSEEKILDTNTIKLRALQRQSEQEKALASFGVAPPALEYPNYPAPFPKSFIEAGMPTQGLAQNILNFNFSAPVGSENAMKELIIRVLREANIQGAQGLTQ